MESALIELVHAIAKIGKEANIFSISDDNISIDFDDSIIESKEQEIKKDRLDVEMGAMSLIEYRMKWYGEDEKIAKSKIEKINRSNNTHNFSKKEDE